MGVCLWPGQALATSPLTALCAAAQGEMPLYNPDEMVFEAADEKIPELPKHMRGDDDSDLDEDDLDNDLGPSTSDAGADGEMKGGRGGRGGRGRGAGGRRGGRGSEKKGDHKRKREDAMEKEKVRRLTPLVLKACSALKRSQGAHMITSIASQERAKEREERKKEQAGWFEMKARNSPPR